MPPRPITTASVTARGCFMRSRATAPSSGISLQAPLHVRAVAVVRCPYDRHVVDGDRDAVLLDDRPAAERTNLGQRQELAQGDDTVAELAEDPERPRLVHVDLAPLQPREHGAVDVLQVNVTQARCMTAGELDRIAAADDRVSRVDAEADVGAGEDRL